MIIQIIKYVWMGMYWKGKENTKQTWTGYGNCWFKQAKVEEKN